MKTPEELINKILEEYHTLNDDDRYLGNEELIKKQLTELIRQAKSKWCKEQRKICNERANFSITNGIYVINENSILDAPEPE